MGSINRHKSDLRIARVYDTQIGAQGDNKNLKEHVKNLRAAVGKADPNALGSRAFNQRFGGK